VKRFVELRLLVVLLMPLPLLLLSGCSSWLVGDSISYNSRAALTGVDIALDADPGRGAYTRGMSHDNTGWQMIQAHLADVAPGQWLVVEIGTNDLARPEAEWVRFVNDVVALVPDSVCLAWVTPFDPAYPVQAAKYEALVNSVLAAQPCRGTIQWDDVARARPDLTVDGYHPTAKGSQVYACMVDQVVTNRNRTGNTVWCVNKIDGVAA
jgi:hypothetical protein